MARLCDERPFSPLNATAEIGSPLALARNLIILCSAIGKWFRIEKKTMHHRCSTSPWHYNDAIMSAMAYQITSLMVVYSNVYSGADQRKHKKKLRVTGLCEGNSPMTEEFPAQRSSNAENVSIWLRHRVHTQFILGKKPVGGCYSAEMRRPAIRSTAHDPILS